MSDLSFVFADNQPSIFGTLAIDGAVLNLATASSVHFQMRLATDRRFAVDAQAVIVNAPLGAVRYDWATGDLSGPGDYVMRWQINWNDGSIQHSDPENTISVRV